MYAQMAHNGYLIDRARKILSDAVENGIYISIENPDGTAMRLKPGFKLTDVEIVLIEEDRGERLDLNDKL